MGYPIEGVVGVEAAPPRPSSRSPPIWPRPIRQGRAASSSAASTCHTIDKGGANGTGPNLWGTVGAPVGHVAGFAYTPDLKALGGNWDWDTLNEWVKNPRGLVPGTKMSFAGLGKPEDRANLLAYLNAQGDSPIALPPPPAAAPAAAAAEAADAGRPARPRTSRC